MVISHHTDDATQAVQKEGAEIRRQRYGQQAIGKGRQLVVREVSETGEESLRQRLDDRVGGSTGIAEHRRQGDAAKHRRNRGESPNGPVWGEVLIVQKSEVFGN